MSCLFVYNKICGGEKESAQHGKIVNYLKSIYDKVDLFEVDNKNSFFDVNIQDYDDVVCAGGDGSISLLVNDLISMGYKKNIGYIPLGTANDFARKIELPLNVDKSLKIIKNKEVENVLLGKVNDRAILYGLAMGKLSSVSYKAKAKYKRSLSKFSYVLEGLKELFSFKKYEINLLFDDYKITFKTPLVLILDAKTIGGFKVNKGNLNKYDVLILKPGLLNGVFAIASIFLFGYKKTNTYFYDYFNLKKFTIETKENQSWCLDGELYNERKIDVNSQGEYISIYKK